MNLSSISVIRNALRLRRARVSSAQSCGQHVTCPGLYETVSTEAVAALRIPLNLLPYQLYQLSGVTPASDPLRILDWMAGTYRSLQDACRDFDAYVLVEPRLRSLWDLCRGAAPPPRAPEHMDDVYDRDPFEVDPATPGQTDSSWCAEDYFLEQVKPRLLLLVGAHREGNADELHSREAYDKLYDLLLNWALNRPCACCAQHDDALDARWHGEDAGAPAHL